MVTFVLVAGARLGGWAWDGVVPHLRAAGHDVRPLTLSGLAEKRGVSAGQQTHVRDIVDEVERRESRDVVLVGHSYAGIPVGQAAGRIGDRLRRVVFVDAEVPSDGASFVSVWPDGGAAVTAEIAEHGGFWPTVPAGHYAGHGLTDEQIARIVAGSTPHPGATLTEPAVLARPLEELPTTYVLCRLAGPEPSDAVRGLLSGPQWRRADLDTGHWPMFSRPRELADVLLDAAALNGPVARPC
ncbi:alpha/beta hydrolase [Streptomyces mobaraensis NBRC 13819 = DSM 40847]|uniref:Esterase n=1 Tax=Streptomyces mobaraensis (strain ATCC 29032 / DSM 40847 / JCM 4168 / NBRC 13819 / NCIMB 11159 / IPCR 16-22) TaxID=1223523 RepID=M3AW18_STRM1|nr:alpha/beta fold hydrolase [Streptomyces mobaraensis]EME97787.1 esterase [Streptomyces mobaraensis NBRC 13819 = DSM 40847]QTT72420.1 alpha/beta hydrolase [Streptomyces mobaraensis NBRC 13819 = DSM 40847]